MENQKKLVKILLSDNNQRTLLRTKSIWCIYITDDIHATVSKS